MNILCAYCRERDVVKRGKRYTKQGVKQLFRCNSCRRVFVTPDGFERMRHRPQIIVRAIHMHEDGMSLSKVQNHLWQHDGIRISRPSIGMWTSKYAVFLKSADDKRTSHDKGTHPLRRESRRREDKKVL